MTMHAKSSSNSSDNSGNSILVEEAAKMSPKVEITVERLEGIIWSTSKVHKSKEELNKSVPFVTAAVEFSGTCPNMKVYNATRYPHLKNPAVESYFATLAPEYQIDGQKHAGACSEIRRMLTTSTTQEMDGMTTKTTTTTTTTTVTTMIKAAAPTKMNDCDKGQYPLIANWYDDSNQQQQQQQQQQHMKSSDSNSFRQASGDDASLPSMTIGGVAGGNQVSTTTGKPHLCITLPSPQEQAQLSLFEALASPCHSVRKTAESSFEMMRPKSKAKKFGKTREREGMDTDTFSTAAETMCSFEDANITSSPSLADRLKPNNNKHHGATLMELGSLMDDDESDDECDNKDIQKFDLNASYQEEAEIRPVRSSHKLKEKAATAIASEPSSGVVGGFGESKTGAFTPLTWMTCGNTGPEIIELRVRVMPEDADDFDEMDPSKQYLPSSQGLEGVAHLVFLDQSIKEGTTVMDLPLKISRGAKVLQGDSTALSTTPNLGGVSDSVSLGRNAMLRVRVKVLPTTESNQIPPTVIHKAKHSQKQSIPEGNPPFYPRSLSMVKNILHIPTHFGKESTAKTQGQSQRAQNDSFTDQFRSVLPEDISKRAEDISRRAEDISRRAESLLTEWKSYSESWNWSKTIQAFSDAVARRSGYVPEDEEHAQKKATNNAYTIKTPAPRTSSTLSQSTGAAFSLADSLFSGLEQ